MEHFFVHRPNYLRSLPPILHLFSHPISPLDLPIMDDICPSAIGNWHEPKTRKCDSVLANDAEWHSSPCGSHLASMSFGFEPFHCNSKSIYSSRDSKAILNQATGHPFVTVIAEDSCWEGYCVCVCVRICVCFCIWVCVCVRVCVWQWNCSIIPEKEVFEINL